MELTEFVRVEQTEQAPYVIMVSGNDSEEHILHALSNGADDYIVKPIDARLIQAKLVVAARFIDIQKKLQKANSLLSTLALVDDITGLVNAEAGIQLLRSAIIKVLETNTPLTVASIVIDDLQGIKARFGQSAYVSVIKQVADNVQSVLSTTDICCCSNQDGLLVWIHAEQNKALELIKKIEAAISSCVCEFDNQPVHSQLKMTEVKPDKAISVEEVMQQLSHSL